MLETLRFIAQAGIFNIRGWKRRREAELFRLKQSGGLFGGAKMQKCPLNQFETPFDEWGEVKIEMNPKIVHANDWIEALQDGPIVVSVQMPPVEGYEGGVHDGKGCLGSGNWHAMILVGYGRNERGVAYWRFRNSWGEDWGDKGHFNMQMEVPGDCLAGGVRVYREPLDL